MVKKESKGSVKKKLVILEEPTSFFGKLFDVSGEKGYHKFVFFLILIDLTWFLSVAVDNLFDRSIQEYGEFLWIFLFSFGLIILSDLHKVRKIKEEGFKSENLSSMITLILGLLALITAFFSLPFFEIDLPVFRAVKGIIAVIAIVYVVLEAWVVKE